MSVIECQSIGQVNCLIKEFEKRTKTKYVELNRKKNFNKEDWKPSKDDQVFFERKSTGKTYSLPFTGNPYIAIGSRYLLCHQGRDVNKAKKRNYAEKRDSGEFGFKKRRYLIRDTKKVDCPAVLNITRVAVIHDEQFQIKKNTKFYRKKTSQLLKCALSQDENIVWKDTYFLYVSHPEEHKGHSITKEAAATCKKIDPEVVSSTLQELTDEDAEYDEEAIDPEVVPSTLQELSHDDAEYVEEAIDENFKYFHHNNGEVNREKNRDQHISLLRKKCASQTKNILDKIYLITDVNCLKKLENTLKRLSEHIDRDDVSGERGLLLSGMEIKKRKRKKTILINKQPLTKNSIGCQPINNIKCEVVTEISPDGQVYTTEWDIEQNGFCE